MNVAEVPRFTRLWLVMAWLCVVTIAAEAVGGLMYWHGRWEEEGLVVGGVGCALFHVFSWASVFAARTRRRRIISVVFVVLAPAPLIALIGAVVLFFSMLGGGHVF